MAENKTNETTAPSLIGPLCPKCEAGEPCETLLSL